MSPRQQTTTGASHRSLIRILSSATVVLIVASGITVAGAGTGGDTGDDPQMIRDVMRVVHANFTTYNDRNWDEFRLTYAEDAVALPTGHDPVRGRDAITEFHQRVREATGPVDLDSIDVVRARANGKIANLVYTFTAQSGHIRAVADVLYERQPDGSVLLGVDQIGFRERGVG